MIAGDKQRDRILAFIGDFTKVQGYAPSYSEIQAALGIASSQSVAWHLEKLRKQGKVTWQPRASRTLRVL